MDDLRELVAWLQRCWIDGGRTMQSHEAGRFRDAAEQARLDLERYRDDENDRETQ
ncbi:hypothetical protein [Paraburkholderia unamae]|uniref:Uncharacterized protein n=1 Tax=Paraburkholderia unamae TaxID=219649 RepID=A0ABX5KMQ4_9BURK|nr:hypothetical protein [Paraburkholderia unamae]PVX81252.1 hypothetical protein C7402_111154 [Paraburkholderia unamae]